MNNTDLTIKELVHIDLLRELRDAKKELPILEVASILEEVYEQEELEIITKKITK